MNRAPKTTKSKTTKVTKKAKAVKTQKRQITTTTKKIKSTPQHNTITPINMISQQFTTASPTIFTPSQQFTPIQSLLTQTTMNFNTMTLPATSMMMKPLKKLPTKASTSFMFAPKTSQSLFQIGPITMKPMRLFSTDSDEVPVPPELEKKYKRLMFQATQRGWLELDLIFSAYVATFKSKLMNEESLNQLTEVCDCDNSDLVRWFVEGRPLPDEWKSNPVMVDMLDYALQPSKPWYPKAGNQ